MNENINHIIEQSSAENIYIKSLIPLFRLDCTRAFKSKREWDFNSPSKALLAQRLV